MFNAATTKNAIFGIALFAVISSFCSCGSSNGKSNEADSLLSQAQLLYDNGEYELSLTLIDSLKNTYPEEIDLNKSGLYLRTLNNEKIVQNEIIQNDSLITVLSAENKELADKFKFIKHKDMVEGYYVHKSISGETGNVDRTGLEPRIGEDELFYIVSYITGHDVKHTAVKVSSKNGNSVSTATVAYDKAQNYRYNDDGKAHESITFYNQQCDTIGQFISDNRNGLKVTFLGKKTYSIPLGRKYCDAIAETYQYARNKAQGKEAIQKRMYLEKKLEIAQKQIEITKANLVK